MKLKLIALVLLITGGLAVGVMRTASTGQKKIPPYKDRLKWYAKEAKAQARQKVTIPGDVVEHLGGAGTITADQAFSSSTVVLAHLLTKESYPRNDDIITWNKFVTDEVLSEAKEMSCTTCGLSDPPASFLPLQSGEFLLSKGGGKVVIDDVEIEQVDPAFPQYEFNQQYLLLITLHPSGTARTFGGPVGVFKVVHDDKLLPVRESEHRIQEDFKQKYHNSLRSLREHLKNK